MPLIHGIVCTTSRPHTEEVGNTSPPARKIIQAPASRRSCRTRQTLAAGNNRSNDERSGVVVDAALHSDL